MYTNTKDGNGHLLFIIRAHHGSHFLHAANLVYKRRLGESTGTRDEIKKKVSIGCHDVCCVVVVKASSMLIVLLRLKVWYGMALDSK